MTLLQILYFTTIVECKSYTKASLKLSVSQPNLSHAIRNLEVEFGGALLVKKGRTIDVTPAGKVFLDHALVILHEIEETQVDVERLLTSEKEVVRLMVSHTLEHSFMPSLIREFRNHTENSNTAISFHPMDSTTSAIELMEAGEIDLGFGARIPRVDCEYFEVVREEMVALVPNIHPWAKRDNITMKELCSESFVTYDRRCGSRIDIEKFFREFEVWPAQIIEANNERMITGIVAAGMGVSIVPYIDEISQFPVSAICLENHSIYRSLYMFWKNNSVLSPSAERFRRFIIRKMSKSEN